MRGAEARGSRLPRRGDCRRFADAPARRGGSRRRRLAIRPQDDRRGAAGFGGKLQSAGGGQAQFGDFADRRGEAAAAQPFLHRPKRIRVAARPHQKHPLDAENPQRRRVRLAGVERPGLSAPKDELPGAGQPAGQQGAESRRGARVRGEHLVQGAAQKPEVRRVVRRACVGPPDGLGAVRRIVAGEPAAYAMFKHGVT